MKIKIKYGGMLFEKEEKAAIDRVLKKNWWQLAEEGKEFEKELAEYMGTKFAVFVNSGSSALLLAFMTLARQRDYRTEIIVPATCFPTAISAIVYAGFKPVVVDVDLKTFLIDPIEVEKAVNNKTFGILAVHVAGNICDMDRLQKIAYNHNLRIIEDNCDGFGGNWGGRKAGFINLSVASFHAAHIISTGQGGAVFTNSEWEYKKIKELRDWGRKVDFDDNKPSLPPLPEDYQQRYTYTDLGFNLNPIELQAAIGREQLKKIERFKKARKENFEYLKEELTKLGYQVVEKYDKADPCWFTIPFLVPKEIPRKIITDRLNEAGIEYRNILASNIKLHPAYNWLYGSFPNADEIARRGLWLPVHPSLKEEQLKYIVKTLKI
jgi:CDP-6-deoxy-D-xylo-4-hexulose-3-dehydrase